MNINIRNIVWGISLLFCFPLYSLGQIYLFISKQKENEFYNLLNKYGADWLRAHFILMISVVLLIPAFIALCYYFKNTKAYFLVQLSAFFTYISVFVLFGQFTIDLTLIEIFRLPEETAYGVLNNIQNNPDIRALFYDNSRLFFLFKYFDFTLLSHLLLGIALIISKKVPKWTIVLFFIAFVLTQFGILIDPFYGRIIKRLSYTLISISLLPISIKLFKGYDLSPERGLNSGRNELFI